MTDTEDNQTYEEFLEETAPYCEPGIRLCEDTGNLLKAWWLSELALNDVDLLHSVQ